jgi:deoxyribodipyrimidine photolyase-like uncharacterized protein
MRYRKRLETNPRMGTIIRNLDRFGPEECEAIRDKATELRKQMGVTRED